MEQLKIGIGVSSIGRFLPLLGKAAGLFEKQGIDVEVVNQQDEEKIVEDIVAQTTPIGTPNSPSLIFSHLKGNDLVIVGGVLNRPAFYLAAQPQIKYIDDLKGKRVGINQPRRMAGLVMLALLRRRNLRAEKDLTVVDLGLNDKSFEALRQREIDAALLPPEKAFLAEAEGFSIVADSLDLDCQWVPLTTTGRFLASHRELVKKVAAIYVESIHLFRNQPRHTLQEIAHWLPALEKQPQALEKCYKLFAALFEPTLSPSLDSLNAVLSEVSLQDPKARVLKAASLVENVI